MNLKLLSFAQAYWAEMFRSFFGRIKTKQTDSSKLTDLYRAFSEEVAKNLCVHNLLA